MSFYIPDIIFPGDRFGIPWLDLQQQGEFLAAPMKMWGQNTRRQVNNGTFGFYTRDYKFSALWKHPEAILNSGCAVVIEPNFSTSPDMPEAVALYDIFRKRWLARYWQMHNVKVIVDLNVAERFFEMNLLGVPDGYSCFATRAQKGSNELIPRMFELARQKAGRDPKLFMVYGGGKQVEQMCRDRGWFWVKEQMQQVKEDYYGEA